MTAYQQLVQQRAFDVLSSTQMDLTYQHSPSLGAFTDWLVTEDGGRYEDMKLADYTAAETQIAYYAAWWDALLASMGMPA